MFLRIFSLCGLSSVMFACGQGTAPEPDGETIACAIGPGSEFSPVCTLENDESGDAFLIHHPNGGFRRFVSDDNGAYKAADGAADLIVVDEQAGSEAMVEFSVDGDRYRLGANALAVVSDE